MPLTELQERILAFYQLCEENRGSTLEIQEFISRSKSDFDRHWTVHTTLVFQYDQLAWRISGGTITLLGARHSYEICADVICNFTDLGAHTFEILEQYSETVFRKTIIAFPSALGRASG